MIRGVTLKRVLLVVLITIFAGLTIYTYKSIKSNNNIYNKDINSLDVNGKNKEKVKIGLSLGTLKEERWIRDRDILMAKAQEMGAEMFVQNANNDDKDQIKQVRYLLDQGIDVLILVPNDLEKAAEIVKIAKSQGVKVISYDRLVLNSNVDLYISFDNEKVGELMAQYLKNAVPKGNYLIINGATSDNNTKKIKEGYDKILQKEIENGNINLLAEEWAPNWMTEYAFSVTDKMLQSGTRIDAIISGDDSLAGGIIKALSEHRLAGRTAVVGQDADLAACQRVVEGTQLMTVYKPIDKIAEATAQIAIKMAKGESLNINKTISDGTYEIPYYVLEPIAVDKENIMSTVIKDGFHLKDEVYRNVTK